MRNKALLFAASIAIGVLLDAWPISFAGERALQSQAREASRAPSAKIKKRVAAQRALAAIKRKPSVPSLQTSSELLIDADPSPIDRDRGFSILHIGDSHTSADFFTGEIRRKLQSRFGYGAPGYITAGHPHIGVRSASFKVTTSPGWTYKSIQRPDALTNSFWLSGYNSLANEPEEVMTFSSERPIEADVIEIETMKLPGGGSIEVSVDGKVVRQEDLSSDGALVPRVLKVSGFPRTGFNEFSIRVKTRGLVVISSVGVYSHREGLTYNSVGYVGATVNVLNKFDERLFTSDISRLNPKIVVLSFGTNEASNEQIDIPRYAAMYERAITTIQRQLPSAVIVIILPPDFNEASPECRKENIASSVCRPPPADVSTPRGQNSTWEGANAALEPARAQRAACVWHTPSKLADVRAAQKRIAEENGLLVWDWGRLVPSECGAHEWFMMNPPLMSRDHVHFTAEGYRRSAESFLGSLVPVVERISGLKASLSAK